MAMCMNCGAVLNDDDVMPIMKHKCKAANIPIKGKEKIPNTTVSDVV